MSGKLNLAKLYVMKMGSRFVKEKRPFGSVIRKLVEPAVLIYLI